jgi:hypothetical protein
MIPEGYMKEEAVIPLIQRACGEIVCLEMIHAGTFNRHDVCKPLTRAVSIAEGENDIFMQ